jgi:arabinose-5-phosphate isomerase
MSKDNKKIIDSAKQVIATEILALKKLLGSIDTSFCQAVNAIANAKGKIVCCGVGKSAKILEKISSTFSSIGISSFTLDPTDAGHGSLGALQKKDILLVASFSGNSSELNHILEYAKKNKIKVMGISSNNQSNLMRSSNIKMLMPSVIEAGNKNLNMIPTSSSLNLLAIGDCLAISVASKKKFSKKNFGAIHPSGSLGKNLSEVSKIMLKGKNIPILNENSSVQNVVLKISSGGLGCVVVLDKKKNVSGMITNGDMNRAIKKFKNIFLKKAGNIMSKKPKTISTKILVVDALKIMNKKKITTLIVTKNKKPYGIVHMHDILSFLGS